MSYQQFLDRISEAPRLWNILRWIVEAGFYGEKRVIEQELAPWREVGQRMFLDFGCGTGEFAACFPAAQYVGIDPARAYIRFATRSRRGRFIASTGEAMPLESEQFDAALVLGVLHHLPDATVSAAMRELHRVLRPGAIVLVMEDVPPPDPWNLAGHAMHWLDRGGFIRSEADYRALFGAGFALQHAYHMRSGICDYGVYVLQRGQSIAVTDAADVADAAEAWAEASDTCLHDSIIVDYHAPHGEIIGVSVRDLQDLEPEDTPPRMQLLNARCGDCGALLDSGHLLYRIRPGGDLHDARFQWIWDASNPTSSYSSGEAPFW